MKYNNVYVLRWQRMHQPLPYKELNNLVLHPLYVPNPPHNDKIIPFLHHSNNPHQTGPMTHLQFSASMVMWEWPKTCQIL